MFSLLVVFKHSANMASNTDNILFLYGSIAVDFFFVISGYFMTKSALKNNTDKNTIGKDTIIYIIKKLKAFFPYILISFIIALMVKNWTMPLNISQKINSIWNLFLLEISGIRYTNVLEQTWYISAMIVSMMIIYPCIKKFGKNYIYIVSPLIVVFIAGYISRTYGNLKDPLGWNGIVYKGLLRAFFELNLGAILYEIVNKIRKVQFTKASKIILTLIENIGFISIFVIANLDNADKKYDFVALLIISISVILAFSENNIFYKHMNNKFIYYLEKLSFPIYLNHLWIIKVVRKTLGDFTYIQKLIITIICTIVVSMVILFLVEKIKKIIENHKTRIKKFFINEDSLVSN